MWIGGVAFVTMVIMPVIRRRYPPNDRLATFRTFEGPFSLLARIWVTLAGASGAWMLWRGHLWPLLVEPRFWWLDAMVLLWLAFAAMLYVIEPIAHRAHPAQWPREKAFGQLEKAHRLALTAALITIAGAVAGSHGLL
nr:hypothetical protein [Sphingomonas vulcanisoli]